MDVSSYSEEQKQIGLTFVSACRGDFGMAARKSNLPENALRYWSVTERERAEADPLYEVEATRPRPPLSLIDSESEFIGTLPAPEVAAWVEKTILCDYSPLSNEDHWHLSKASVGYLWTNVPCKRQGNIVVGMAEIPLATIKNAWLKARAEQQLKEWFAGEVPDFVITLSAHFCAEANDPTWCALVDHEMYHCAPARDMFGFPKFHKKTGKPIWTIKGHDVEEFVGVVRRYGPGAAAGATAELVQAAQGEPEIAVADISRCCGACLK